MNKNKFYRWIPGIGLIVLTIGLLFFFKNDKNSLDEIVNTAEATFANFYTQNLKPLFYTTDISNEEVFNFAMNENLLINRKDDEYLQMGTQDSDDVYFEIKKGKDIKPEENYESFVSKLNLDAEKKKKLDSLLNSYKGQIYAGILSDTAGKAVAVNPKLLYTHSALVADLMNFTEEVIKPLVPKAPEPPEKIFMDKKVIADLKKAAQERYKENYILIHPDTVFQTMVAFNKKKMRKEIEEVKNDTKFEINELEKFNLQLDFENEELNDTPGKSGWVVKEDSGNFRIVLNQFSEYTKNIPELLSAKKELDSISVMLRELGVELDINSDRMKVNVNTPDGEKTNVVVDFTQIDSIVSESMKMIFSGGDEQDWEEFGRKMDSMAQKIEVTETDSSSVKKNKK